MSQIQNNLNQAGIVLPTPTAPIANYVGTVIAGNLLVISGQLCLGADGKLDAAHRGKLGNDVSLEAGQAAARLCAINLLAQANIALGGNLDRIRRCVRLGGFINANPTYAQIPQVMPRRRSGRAATISATPSLTRRLISIATSRSAQ